jgi:hypothetical protein
VKKIIRSLLLIVCRCLYPSFDAASYHAAPSQIIKYGFMQKIVGFNRRVPWPVHFTSQVTAPGRITRNPRASCPGFMPGCYIQGNNGITIGSDTRIGPGVKIISANHDIGDISNLMEGPPVVIGDRCWVAANAVILPGVTLGEHVIVGAGAVVTKSFPEGHCVIGGVPARIIRRLDGLHPAHKLAST